MSVIHKRNQEMAKIISPLILLLVVMGLIAIHLSQVTSSTSNQENILNQDAQKFQRYNQVGDSKEEVGFDGKGSPSFNFLYHGISPPGMVSSKTMDFETNDDDHSNVELNNLNGVGVRYGIIPTETVLSVNRVSDIDSSNIARMLSKILRGYSSRQANDIFTKNQLERKRSFRQLATPKEDKDYSFVLQPLSSMNKYYLASRRASPSSPAISRWATQKLRDMLITNGKSYR